MCPVILRLRLWLAVRMQSTAVSWVRLNFSTDAIHHVPPTACRNSWIYLTLYLMVIFTCLDFWKKHLETKHLDLSSFYESIWKSCPDEHKVCDKRGNFVFSCFMFNKFCLCKRLDYVCLTLLVFAKFYKISFWIKYQL